MKAIVLGTNQLLGQAQRLLGCFDELCILSYIELQNGDIIAKRIEQMYAEKLADAPILAVPNRDAEEITSCLKGMNGGKVFYIPHYANDLSQPGLDEMLIQVDINKPRLCYLEFDVCDHCNLKCKACSHYCNIEEDKIFADIDSFSLDRASHRL